MPYGECKIYFDGSHYIAIPHTTRPSRRRFKSPEEEIEVTEYEEQQTAKQEETIKTEESAPPENDDVPSSHTENEEQIEPMVESKPKSRTMTRKELFEELYQKSAGQSRSARKKFIVSNMKPYFKDEDNTTKYVEVQFERKLRNLICRRVRLTRKVNLQDFNYFCTFTYDSALHTEETFRQKLKNYLRNLCYRKGWKYIGVWERSPEKNRLHFHGIFYIPDGTMRELVPIEDYNINTHKRQITYQNIDFNSRFGRSDFVAINSKLDLGEMMQYIIKYLEKTGEKLVYSKGLPQFFISDIMDKDVAAPIGIEDKKLLLFDDFSCWNEGEYIGEVSAETISKLRKVN